MEHQTMHKTSSGFHLFGAWLRETWRNGRGCANLWIYFIVGIILCGGSGFWLLALQKHLELKQPDMLMIFCSFAPAIAGASCMDFIFGENERKYLRGFSILFGALVLVFTFIAFFGANYWFAGIATLLSLSLWWLSNAENPKLSDTANPSAPIGGVDLNQPVAGTTGGIAL